MTEKPKFMFKAKAVHVEKVESGTVEMEQEYQITVRDSDGNIVPSTKCKIYLSDGSTEEVTTDSNGLVILEHKIPGVVEMIEIQNEEGESELLYYANNEE